MKLSLSRAIAVAAALALSIVPAFAQLTINGYYRVGSMTNVPKDASATMTAFQDRIRLNISFAAPDDMFGFKARLQKDSAGNSSALVGLFTNGSVGTGAANGVFTAGTGAPPILKYGYGYGKLLDGVAKLSAGYLDLTDYSVAENTGNYYFGNVFTDDLTGANTGILSGQKGRFLGSALQIWPIEGLSVAATLRTDGSAVAAHHLGFDAYYLIPGLGKAIASSQLGVYSATAASASDELSRSFVSGGFSYFGFPGLTATAVLRSTYSNSAAAIGAVAIVEYNAGPIFADISTDVDFTNSHYYLEGEASYIVIPQVKVRVYGAMADAASNNINLSLTNTLVVANKYSVGADLVLPIGKGEIQAGVVYGDVANIQFPILVKANF
jgi:hypothetical protein